MHFIILSPIRSSLLIWILFLVLKLKENLVLYYLRNSSYYFACSGLLLWAIIYYFHSAFSYSDLYLIINYYFIFSSVLLTYQELESVSSCNLLDSLGFRLNYWLCSDRILNHLSLYGSLASHLVLMKCSKYYKKYPLESRL